MASGELLDAFHELAQQLPLKQLTDSEIHTLIGVMYPMFLRITDTEQDDDIHDVSCRKLRLV